MNHSAWAMKQASRDGTAWERVPFARVLESWVWVSSDELIILELVVRGGGSSLFSGMARYIHSHPKGCVNITLPSSLGYLYGCKHLVNLTALPVIGAWETRREALSPLQD